MNDVFIVETGNELIRAEVNRSDNKYQISLNGAQYQVEAIEVERNVYSMLVGQESFEIAVKDERSDYQVYLPGMEYAMKVWNENRLGNIRGPGSQAFKGTGNVMAPMPGKVVKILVKEGETIEEGTGVIVIEAMKMENELKSPVTGVVGTIHVREGMTVDSNEPLLEIQ